MTPAYAAPLTAVQQLDWADGGDGGFSLTAQVDIDAEHPCLRGHFPQVVIYPGVFVVESLRQAMMLALEGMGKQARLSQVKSLRLIAPLLGGDRMMLQAQVSISDGGWLARAVGSRSDGVAAATVRACFDKLDGS